MWPEDDITDSSFHTKPLVVLHCGGHPSGLCAAHDRTSSWGWSSRPEGGPERRTRKWRLPSLCECPGWFLWFKSLRMHIHTYVRWRLLHKHLSPWFFLPAKRTTKVYFLHFCKDVELMILLFIIHTKMNYYCIVPQCACSTPMSSLKK